MNNFSAMWNFPVKERISFKYANRVHPLMQERVDVLLKILTEDSNISRIVLFGSSLEFRCSSGSDIDLYIEKLDENKKLPPLPELGCEIDIITNLSHDSRLYRQIEKTGLLLYERSSHV